MFHGFGQAQFADAQWGNIKKSAFNRVQLSAAAIFWAYYDHCGMIQIKYLVRICALFWFIPFSRWQNKLGLGQFQYFDWQTLRKSKNCYWFLGQLYGLKLFSFVISKEKKSNFLVFLHLKTIYEIIRRIKYIKALFLPHCVMVDRF